jgi:2-oxoglutarate dehydrogenase E1 component
MLDAASNSAEGEIALVRVEQLYPFPTNKISALVARYKNAKDAVWAQEEPQNMGAWTFVRPHLESILDGAMNLKYIGRRDSGTTAEGSAKGHTAEQTRIVEEVKNLNSVAPKKRR